MVRGQYTLAAIRGTPTGLEHWLCPQQEPRIWSGSWVNRKNQGMTGGVWSAPGCQDGLQNGSEELCKVCPLGGGLMEGEKQIPSWGTHSRTRDRVQHD